MSKDASLKLIRGSRIIEQLIQESSLGDLEKNSDARMPSERGDSAKNNVQNVSIEPIKRQNSDKGDLKTEFKITSGSSGKSYSPVIYFMNVEFEETDEPDNISFQATDGETHHVRPVSMSKTNVKVRCTCMDFYYRFASRNSKDQSLYGNPPPPYKRRTTTHPSANPQYVPGVCKHILAGAHELENSGLITS